MKEEGINQAEIGNRQHYLRWRTPVTARNISSAGVNYDTSLGFAEQAGFRCGTSCEFHMFDLETRSPLPLRQRPLIAMECSVTDACYMGLGVTEEALVYMHELKRRCLQFGRDFTLLWHNDSLQSEEARTMYRELIA